MAIVALVGVLIAILGSVGNAIAFLFARIELRAQRKETRELAELTSELQQDFHRLSVELDQDIQTLYLARQTLVEMHTILSRLQMFSNFLEKGFIQNTDSIKVVDDLASLNAQLALLTGIVFPIKDDQLTKSIYDFGNNFNIEQPTEALKYLESSKPIAAIHTRISELIAETTKAKK